MKNMRIHIRPSTKCGSKYWAVEKHNIVFQDGAKSSFTVHGIRWFKNKALAVDWVSRNNPRNIPVKIGW